MKLDDHNDKNSQSFSLSNWRTYPHNRVAFSNVKNILPVSIIKKGEKTKNVRSKLEDLSSLKFTNKYKEEIKITDFLQKSFSDSFLIIKKGKKIFEWHNDLNLKNNQHILFSVSKSLTSLLAGILIKKNLIEPNKEITFYLPEVRESAYKNSTIRNLLDMTVSSNFKEDYLDKTGLFKLYREATGFNPQTSKHKIGLKGFLTMMPKSEINHGEKYQYCSPNTDLLGWIIERVSETKFSNLFSNEIYQKCKPSNDAYVTLDHEDSPRTAGGICMTSNDLSKVAEMVRCKGSLEGKQIISEDVMTNLIDYENKHSWPNKEVGRLFPKGGYRSKWYQSGLDNKEICAIGIHGQWIWIDPIHEVSIVMLSSRKQPLSISNEKNFSLLCLEICKQTGS